MPIRQSAGIAKVETSDTGLLVETSMGETYSCDAVAVGHGLTPSTKITRLLGVRHRYASELGGWVATQDPFGRASVDGLLVAGGDDGLRGAAALAGELAGLTAARDHGKIDQPAFEGKAAILQPSLQRASRFGGAMSMMMAPSTDDIDALSPETIVCHCEDVIAGQLDAAITAGTR